MENNQAFVASLCNIREIPGADKIKQADVMLKGIKVAPVVVGLETQEGERIVYFDGNLCLNSETILSHYSELATYLGRNGRVRTIKLRGVYSDGLCVSLDKFVRYDAKAMEWEDGFAFTEIKGKEICSKYTPPVKVQPQPGNKTQKGKTISRMIPGLFHFHIDTEQLARNIYRINPDDVISISRKVHGSSGITSYCLVKKKLSVVDRIFKFFGASIVDTEYDYIFSSRRVVKNGKLSTDPGFYSEDIWTKAGQVFVGKLAKGETIYFEIIGYLSDGKWIQKNYDYGCRPGEHKIQIYRITKTSEDGHVVEYGWQAMKERCQELGVEHVEEFYFGRARDKYDIIVNDGWHSGFLTSLQEGYLEKDVPVNLVKTMPDEGVVIRRESKDISVFKLKSLKFLKKESEAHENDEENIEDQG
jgi:hypothetical protein